MRIVWYNFDIPGPLYSSNRGTFEDACNVLFRVPERGKFIRSVTLICSSHVNRQVRHPSDDPEVERVSVKLFSLMPKVHSVRILMYVGGPPMDSARVEEYQRLHILECQVLARWASGQVAIRQIKSIYGSPEDVLGLASCCSQLTHLSLDFTRQDLAQLDANILPTLPPTMLPRLSDLEINIEALPFLTPYLRSVVNLRFHSMLSFPSQKVIATAAEALRESKNLRTLQFPNLPSWAVGQLLLGLGPIESLRTVVERDKKVFEEPLRGDDWVREFRKLVAQVPALETYVITTTSGDPSASRQHIFDCSEAMNRHFPESSSPAFQRMVIDFLETSR